MTNQKIVTRLEFAEHIYHNIQPGETYSFYQKNEDDHRLYYPHFVILVKLADSELLVANFHGGGNPFVFERREGAFHEFRNQFEEYLDSRYMGEQIWMDITPATGNYLGTMVSYGISEPMDEEISVDCIKHGSYISIPVKAFAEYLFHKALFGVCYEFFMEDVMGHRRKYSIAMIEHSIAAMFLCICYDNARAGFEPLICDYSSQRYSDFAQSLEAYFEDHFGETLFVTTPFSEEIWEYQAQNKKNKMDRSQFQEYLQENFHLSAEAQRFAGNILAYAEQMADKDDAKEFLYTMFDGTIGISEAELDMLQL